MINQFGFPARDYSRADNLSKQMKQGIRVTGGNRWAGFKLWGSRTRKGRRRAQIVAHGGF